MGKIIHKLTNIDPVNRTADCANCGNIRIYWKVRVWRCKIGAKRTSSKRDYSYLAFKKDSCERCGFIPQTKEQLDVDHIDGDSSNSLLENLMTLCANCHRLKTFRPDLFWVALSLVDHSTTKNARLNNQVVVIYKYERCGSLISISTTKAPNRLETVVRRS